MSAHFLSMISRTSGRVSDFSQENNSLRDPEDPMQPFEQPDDSRLRSELILMVASKVAFSWDSTQLHLG